MLNVPWGRSGQAGQGLLQPLARACSPDTPQLQAQLLPDTYQSFTEREPVADSPITLFSLGSPYSSSSPWSASAAVNSTTSPNEWNKLMAVKSMVGSALVRKSSRASPLPHEGSGDLAKGLLKRSSSKHLGSEATAKPGSIATAGPKTGRRAVFSRETIKTGFLATHDNNRRVASEVLPPKNAAVQSSGGLASPATQPATAVLSSPPEVTFAEKLAIALPDLQPAFDQQDMQQQAVPEGAIDLIDTKLSAADKMHSYVFKRSLSSVSPQRTSVPVASPLSRVVTYRPDQLRAAYQPPDLVNSLSQNRVQDSMWEENPVAATLRYSGMTVEQREKQVEFAAQLGQWYKEQLQRRVPSRGTNTRTVTIAE